MGRRWYSSVGLVGLFASLAVCSLATIYLVKHDSGSTTVFSAPRNLFRDSLDSQDYMDQPYSGQSIDCAQLIERVVQNLTSRLNRIDAKESSQQTSEAQVLDNRAESLTQLPTIFMITPTYYRWTQKADLVRLCQTLMHVQNLHWIVVEDEVKNTELVTNFLERCKVSSTHLSVKSAHKLPAKAKKHSRHRLRRIKIKAKPKTTAKKKVKGKGKTKVPRKSRGVDQRNFALQWLRDNYSVGDVSGVVYFGDDDNTYDIQIFEEMRYTTRASVWPVGIAGGLRFEGPVCENDTVIGWHAAWGSERLFQVDFAGVAVNLDVILSNPLVTLRKNSAPGYLESDYLAQIVSGIDELEAKCDDCTKVYVWHTQTKVPLMTWEIALIKNGTPSNPLIEA